MKDCPSTYFVQDTRNKKELNRLTIQDQMMTTAMGGVLAEQPDPTIFRRVLDVACGTGGWVIEAARTYPTMSLVGVDISQRMIKYAYAQAEDYQVDDRVEFYIMDVLGTLDFPAAFFDLVNLRLGISFLRTWDWPKLLREFLRVTRPGGVVRVTESETIHQSNSPALTQLFEMLQSALFRGGYLFTEETTGVTDHVARLLDQCGCEQVQTKAHTMGYRLGTSEGEACYENVMLGFQTVRPFIEKWGCGSKDYGVIYHHALKEMHQPDFLVKLNLLTAWGNKPR
jgi:ubiquinone/menaquinone biosynthesis C-methylase UbiE